MIIRHRFLLLIHILCCAATIHGILLDANDAETCSLLCIQCNASAVFANGYCECNFADDSDKVSGAECIQRIQREIQAIESNMLSEDLTDEERKERSILKYRRRLRPESVPYASPTMQGAEMYPPILRAVNPVITYPSEVYDPMISLSHPHGLSHTLIRAATLPAHVLHHILHPRVYHHPVYHRGIVRSTNFLQDRSDVPIIGQSCENNSGSTTPNLLTTKSNADKPAEQNVPELIDSSQYPRADIIHTYQPVQYQNLPYQYSSYYGPLINLLHPLTNGYVLQPVSPYRQDIADPLTSAFNPYSSCENNANTNQRNGVLTAEKTIYSNDGTEKSDNPKNDISEEEKKTEKNGIDKS